jgi:demethylspheroidene O-methyltransferase
MVLHHAMLYADLADPVALLRGERRGGCGGGERAGDGSGSTELARYWPYAAADMAADMPAERVAAYTELMSASQPLVTQEILAAYPFRRHRCLMDVGGGDGTFLEAVGRHVPGLRLVLVDLPAVARRAEARFAAAGLAGRAGAVGADFLNDPLPRGADIVSLVRVVHDHDDARVLRLLRAVRAALPPDGTLLIAEPMAGTPGAEPVGGAYFGFYLLAMGRGRARTPAELDALLRQAGFDRVRPLRTDNPLVTSLLVARPAAAPRNV